MHYFQQPFSPYSFYLIFSSDLEAKSELQTGLTDAKIFIKWNHSKICRTDYNLQYYFNLCSKPVKKERLTYYLIFK